MFDTKFAIVLRDDLPVWQKLNVTAFLTSGIVAQFPELIGEPYRDRAGNIYNPLSIQPVIVLSADGQALGTIQRRALERGVRVSLYVEEMFSTTIWPTVPSLPNLRRRMPRWSASRFAPKRSSSTRSPRVPACTPDSPATRNKTEPVVACRCASLFWLARWRQFPHW